MDGERALGIAVLALAATTWLAGCPGLPPAAERPLDGTGGAGGGACGDVEATVFAVSCAGGTCHGPGDPAQGLDLVSPGLASRVVGQPAHGCGGVLADPQHPEDSALYDKLLDAPGCGARMPLHGDPLSEDEIACVKAWIATL